MTGRDRQRHKTAPPRGAAEPFVLSGGQPARKPFPMISLEFVI